MLSTMGIVGLGVMGHNLALNIGQSGFSVAGYDLDHARVESLRKETAAGRRIAGADSPAALMAGLEKPRRVLLMVPAGAPVDSAIAFLKPYLTPGDILIDGGNSFFLDTERRNRDLAAEGIHFLGVGISGGEEGALVGPSIMPGGQQEAWEAIAPVLQAIAAQAEDGAPCVEYMGPRGAGHFVKMVHNGIEYGDMQLIAEVYDILRRGLGLTAGEIGEVFAEWNTGELRSYLVEITSAILGRVDEESGQPLVDLILDEAQQKGTGKWANQNALDMGAPIPTINAAVECRILSALRPQRLAASRLLKGPAIQVRPERKKWIAAAREALYAGKIITYAQGLDLLRIASEEYRYNLRLENIAKIWRAGCIIRAALLNDIMTAYRRDPVLINLLLDESFRAAVEKCQAALRKIVQEAAGMGIPALALSASLAYFDAYRSERLPANLIQAQRDYFGAHTYRRIDREGSFHTDWGR